jgi:hypothetical protein
MWLEKILFFVFLVLVYSFFLDFLLCWYIPIPFFSAINNDSRISSSKSDLTVKESIKNNEEETDIDDDDDDNLSDGLVLLLKLFAPMIDWYHCVCLHARVCVFDCTIVLHECKTSTISYSYWKLSTNRLNRIKETEEENETSIENQSSYQDFNQTSRFLPTPIEYRE